MSGAHDTNHTPPRPTSGDGYHLPVSNQGWDVSLAKASPSSKWKGKTELKQANLVYTYSQLLKVLIGRTKAVKPIWS